MTNHQPASLQAILQGCRTALAIGIGGGGDVVGTVPTLDLLDLVGVGWVAGGLTWERIVHDPRPGPRALSDIQEIERLAPAVGLASGDTRTFDGVVFAESLFAAELGVRTLLVDINQGARGVAQGLAVAAERLGAGAIFGIDVGGDSLAEGGEPGLRSPLADAILLAALRELSPRLPCILGIIGFGSDGELTPAELEQRMATVAAYGGYLGAWGITAPAAGRLDRLVQRIITEASAIPARSARGALGTQLIRDGTREVPLGILTTVTFYLDAAVVVDHVSRPARAVAGSTTLDEANDALHRLGLRMTELDRERLMVARGTRSYRDFGE